MATAPADNTVPCPGPTSVQRRSSFQPMPIKRPSPAWTGSDAVHTVLPGAIPPIPAQSRRGRYSMRRTTCALVPRQGIYRLIEFSPQVRPAANHPDIFRQPMITGVAIRMEPPAAPSCSWSAGSSALLPGSTPAPAGTTVRTSQISAP